MGRKKGSKNKNKTSLSDDLIAEVTQQDEAFVHKDNAKVLGVANGESTDDEEQDSEEEWLPSLTATPEASSLISASQPTTGSRSIGNASYNRERNHHISKFQY